MWKWIAGLWALWSMADRSERMREAQARAEAAATVRRTNHNMALDLELCRIDDGKMVLGFAGEVENGTATLEIALDEKDMRRVYDVLISYFLAEEAAAA